MSIQIKQIKKADLMDQLDNLGIENLNDSIEIGRASCRERV